MATPRMARGSQRNGKNNAVLVKARVGQVKLSTRDLPNQGHAFGLEVDRDTEGAGAGMCVLACVYSEAYTYILWFCC